MNHHLQWLQGLKIDSGLLDLGVTPFLLAIRNLKIDGKVVKLEILWAKSKSKSPVFLDGIHIPWIFFGFQPFKIGGFYWISPPSPVDNGEHHQWFSFPDRTSNDQILHRGELEHVQMQLHLGFLQEERNRIMESFRYIFPIFGDMFFGKNLCGDIFKNITSIHK